MRLLAIPLLTAFGCVVFGFPVLASDRLLTVDKPYWSALRDAVEAVEAYGGRPKIVIAPHFIIADIPAGSEDALQRSRSISGIHAGELDPAEFSRYGASARQVIASWNNVFMGKAREMGLEEPPSTDRRPLINDVIPSDHTGLLSKPPGAKVFDTSEFMLGSITLAVVLAESDGSVDPNTEDWTQAEEDNVTSEIVAGLNWYLTKAQWRDITFYTVFNYAVPTGYEPINRPSTMDDLWIGDCLGNLGYATVNAYVNAMRDSLDTDWAVATFIADDTNDVDNQFPDGGFAYAMGGGPRFVMTYDNDGWGIANMDAVMAHEFCHTFYALDEYYEAGVGCTATRGYENVENQNSEYPYGAGGCSSNKPFCIMRSVTLGVARLCYFTQGQIGWWDDDGDSIPNILDLPPETELYAYTPDPCSTSTPAYAGSSWVEMLPNLNPSGKGNDITLNRISKVEYRVDGGDWHDASPNDGAWDEGKEGFHFTPDPLGETTHIIEARAWHTYDLSDTTYAADTLTIEGTSGLPGGAVWSALAIDIAPNPFGPRVEVSYSIPGEYGKPVAVSMKVYDVRGREVASLIESVRGPGPGRVTWDGTYSNGSMAPSGIYFVDLVAGDSRLVRKLVMTR